MYKLFLVTLLAAWIISACSETDAGIQGMPPQEVLPDEEIVDSLARDTTGGIIDSDFGGPHVIEQVEMPEGYWAQIRNWPGVPGDSSIERRWGNVKVSVDAVYTKRDPNDRFGGLGDTPWFSIGLYAAPAEVITIKKPEGLRGKRVVCRIGASNCTLTDKHKPWKRLPQTVVTRVLNDDTTRIYNYCGGNIYIIPDQPFVQPEEFVISGAIKSPDFILGKTDARKWMEEISKTTVPFAELIGKRVIWTMPTGDIYLRNVKDPVALMEFYDDAVLNDFFSFHGISESSFNTLHRAPTFPSRLVPDIQVCAGAAHAGYPCMFGMNYASRGVNLEMMRTTNNAWGFYHEVGHNYQVACWKWSDGPGSIGEVSNNFHIMHSRNRLFNKWHDGTDVYQSKIDLFMADPIDSRDFEIDDETKVDGTTRLIPFCQLAQQYGWKLFAYLSTKSRELPKNIANILGGSAAEGRKDFFCISTCEYAGVDLREFFDAWGIHYTTMASGVMAKLPKYDGYKFWEKWEENMIPDLKKERKPVKVDDFTYGKTTGEVDRRNWVVVTDECVHAFTNSSIINMFDGAAGTYWASEGVTRPIFDIQPVIVVDMQSTYQINYVEIQHWNNGYFRQNCQRFRVEIKDYYGDDWQSVGEFETRQNKDFQRFELSDDYNAQFIRLTFLEGFHEGGNTTGSIMVAEFKVGKE